MAQLASLTDVHWFMSGEVVLMTLLGVVFVICVLAFRKGLVGELQKVIRKNSG